MTSRPNGMTLKELKRQVDAAVKAGLGDKMILISNDDEGNGFHKVWYDLTTDEKLVEMNLTVSYDNAIGDGETAKDFVILG